jgi:8-oxo-dGTP diphosphatase
LILSALRLQHQIVAVSAFIPKDGKTLIAQRAVDEPFLPNHWENVGGGVEWGEHPLDALVREVKEESGLIVKPVQHYYVHHYLHEAKGKQIIEIATVCEIIGADTVTLSHEHQAYRWVTKSELEKIEPMTPKMRQVVLEGFNYLASV